MADEQNTNLNPFGGGLIHLILVAIVVAGAIGIAFVVAQVAGIVVPGWIITILWIVLAVVVAVVAIKFIAGLINK